MIKEAILSDVTRVSGGSQDGVEPMPEFISKQIEKLRAGETNPDEARQAIHQAALGGNVKPEMRLINSGEIVPRNLRSRS